MRLAEKELIATSRDLAHDLVSYLFCAHEAIHAQTAAERERSLASITRGVVLTIDHVV